MIRRDILHVQLRPDWIWRVLGGSGAKYHGRRRERRTALRRHLERNGELALVVDEPIEVCSCHYGRPGNTILKSVLLRSVLEHGDAKNNIRST